MCRKSISGHKGYGSFFAEACVSLDRPEDTGPCIYMPFIHDIRANANERNGEKWDKNFQR